jgi:hypothetical protein
LINEKLIECSENKEDFAGYSKIGIEMPEVTGSAVLAMVLDEMEALGLIKLKPDSDKEPANRDSQAQEQVTINKKAA